MILVLTILTLSGCIGGMLVSTAARSGYALYNDYAKTGAIAEVTIDPIDMQRLRAQLIDANHVAILANHEMAMSFADFWMDADRQATVLLEYSNPETMTQKQVKAALIATCKQNTDAAVLGRTKNQQGSLPGSTNSQAPITISIKADLYVYSCHHRKFESSSFTVDMNAKERLINNQIEQSIYWHEFGGKAG